MDYLARIMQDVQRSIANGYYQVQPKSPISSQYSFCDAILHSSLSRNAIIAELKPASPSEGPLLGSRTADDLLLLYAASGVSGLSVLTEPTHFGGSLEYLRRASSLGLPVLMKDFVVDVEQLDAAQAHGANAVLLIQTLFERGYSPMRLNTMIAEAQERNLEVLLEVASIDEYRQALKTSAEMIGINNRDLITLRVDLNKTAEILAAAPKDRIVWSLSGIQIKDDLKKLRATGADAFLIGTSVLKADDPGAKLKDFQKS